MYECVMGLEIDKNSLQVSNVTLCDKRPTKNILFSDCSTENYIKLDGSEFCSVFLAQKMEFQKAVEKCRFIGGQLLSEASEKILTPEVKKWKSFCTCMQGHSKLVFRYNGSLKLATLFQLFFK